MSGGLMQLVAYGAQDVYLTGNPQITFFKAVHKRHTNFANEVIVTSLNNNASFGSNAECVIGRNGDLISRMYLRATLQAKGSATTSSFAWVENIGYHMLEYIELQIGGQKIDKHFSQWLNIWHQLSGDANHSRGLSEMLGNSVSNQKLKHFETADTNERKVKVFVPLNFWFNRNVGLALPLIALQYHEVKVLFKFANANQVHLSLDTPNITITPSFSKCELLVDYIYLDTEERKRFAQQSHEYLIEQVQDAATKPVSAGDTTVSVDLHFNHPCKALYWVNPANHHNDIGTNSLGHGETWVKNFIIRYIMNASAMVAGEGYLPQFVVGTGVSTIETGSDLATLATGSVLNTAYDQTTDAHPSDNYRGLLNALSSVSFVNRTSATITVSNSAVNVDLYDSISLGDNWNEQWGNIPGITNQTITSLDTAGTGIGAVFSTVTSTATSTTSVVSLHKHEFSAGLGRGNTITEAKLKLNGNDRMDWLDAEYYNKVQAWQHHSNTPDHGIYMYSFALNPEDHQPSGTCNFSRIDNAQLELKVPSNSPASQVSVYAVNYNVLRIMSGMGGLAYSN